jgi:subtilisin
LDLGPAFLFSKWNKCKLFMKLARFLSLLALIASTSITIGQVIPDRYIAVFKDDVRNHPAAAQALAAQHGLALGYVYEHALKGFAFGGSPRAAEALAQRAEIAYVEQDQLFHAIGDLPSLPTGINRAEVDVALPIGTDPGVSLADKPVIVAVLDTGADGDHPDLNIVGGIRFYTVFPNRVLSDNNYADGHGHGTHVSGTIGAKDNGVNTVSGKQVVGVAPDIKIYAVKVLNDSGSGSTSAIVAGMDHVAANASTIHVANMSLGGGVSRAMDDAVKRGTDAGIVYVVAAGNSSADVSTTSPARAPSAITVSALADSDGIPGGGGPSFYSGGTFYTGDDTFAPFSNFGSRVDICAPGVLILSTVPGGGYDGNYSGTSMASPHVAGAAALYIAYKGITKTAAGVEAIANALKTSGWHDGELEYILSGDPDGIHEPLLNVGRLMGIVPPPVNKAPSASFTYSASGLTVTFTDTSTDSDGTIVSRSWSFGDSGTSTDQNPLHTYAQAGTYNVTLTVNDDDGATGTVTQPVTVNAPSSGITLTAVGYKVKGKQMVDLSWTGAPSSVTIYRNGTYIATESGTSYRDNLNKVGGGSYTYWVICGSTKSNDATVTF